MTLVPPGLAGGEVAAEHLMTLSRDELRLVTEAGFEALTQETSNLSSH